MNKPKPWIHIDEYNPEWPAMYEQERGRILAAIGDYVGRIEHIGSTSVPGLAAKPVIDIAIDLKTYPLPEQAIRAMEQIGYEHMGEYGIAGRHYFRRGNPRSYHVHAYSPGNIEWDRQIAFREHLRAHPDVARQYEDLKRHLAAQHPNPEDYTVAKTAFVRSILELTFGDRAGSG